MRRFLKSSGAWLLPVVVSAALGAAALGALGLRERAPAAPREILLLARDATFWLPELSDEPNPPMRLARGAPVSLVLRNDEPEKVLHCFTIGGLNVKSTRTLAAGESEVLRFTPTRKGTFAYACLMHPAMSGKVVVE